MKLILVPVLPLMRASQFMLIFRMMHEVGLSNKITLVDNSQKIPLKYYLVSSLFRLIITLESTNKIIDQYIQ